MYFEIQKDSRIWIYGTEIRGEEIFHILSNRGCEVAGFVDQRAQSIKVKCGKEVLLPCNALERIHDDIVVIALQNGLQHDEIAREFFRHNIKKILFLPMSENVSMEKKSCYRRKYFELFQDVVFPITEIPIYEKVEDKLEKDVIRREHERIYFWCDIKCIRTSLYISEKRQNLWDMSDELINRYSDIEITKLKPYTDLFSYLNGEDASLEEYFSIQGRKTDEEKRCLLQDRRRLFNVYQNAMRYELSFFTDAPSILQWNLNGYFNVKDGMHRIMYLISRGYTKVPVVVSEADYQKYILKG